MVSPDLPPSSPPASAHQRTPCPICSAPADLSSPHAPFCSQRCKLADLARWFGGKYKVERPAEHRDYEQE